MTMRERIARAIYEQRNGYGATPWGRREAAHKAPYLSDADAALAAMAEPTEAMIMAAQAGWDTSHAPSFQGVLADAVRAMLAAAGEPE